jgi:hypothetical protein
MLLRMYQYEEEIGELKTKYKIGLERSDDSGYVDASFFVVSHSSLYRKRQVVLQKERVRVDAAGNPEEATSKPRFERENLTASIGRPVVATPITATSAEPTAFT